MKIELYPDFKEVFEDTSLKGIFYPLCKISEINTDIKEPLFFISNNGIWTDETIKNKNNQSGFICFKLQNGKYSFHGDLDVYIGHAHAPKIVDFLEADFLQNGEQYLSQKIKTDDYIQLIKEKQTLDFGDLDSTYFVQTFYEFSINKLNYQKTGVFGGFRQLIDGWGKSDNSSIVYEIKNDNSSAFTDIEINQEYLFPDSIKLEEYHKIGFVIGHEFFTDGNDSYLLFDQKNSKVLNVNHYS